MTITAAWQFELADTDGTAVTFGDSTNYLVRKVDGLGAPPVRASDTPRPRDHGAWLGADYWDARLVTIELVVTGSTVADTVLNVDQLKARFVPSTNANETKTLSWLLPDGTAKMIFGRTRRLDADMTDLASRYVPVTFEFYAADPRIYSVSQYSVTVPIASSSATGRTYDRTYDMTYGTTTEVDGAVQVTNHGTVSVRPLVNLYGPLTNPRIANVTTDSTFEVDVTLTAGQFLAVDFDARTVLLGGSTSRYSSVAAGSVWWELPAGDSTVKLYDGAGSTTGKAYVVYHDAWI